ncbi:DNA methylase [Clostridia bacterium]|nr:DNA methylase [Clostridia bacterium]
MVTYAILGNPGHNRVYFEESSRLALRELAVAFKKMEAQCSNIRKESIAGIGYSLFDSDRELNDRDLQIISWLSFGYALFKFEEMGVLRPVEKNSTNFFDTDFSSILKYSGKTNELFTRLMLSIAELSSAFYGSQEIRLLDPIAGKGTTLFEGLIRGHHVYGIEIGDKVVTESYHFIKKYLENKCYKHVSKTIRFSGEKKEFTVKRYQLEIGRDKKDFKEKAQKSCELISGNSLYTNQYYKKNYFHLIVGDLPYGVQHGNVAKVKSSSITRSPEELLKNCLPGWYDVLKPGGSMVLAWNTYVFPREAMVGLIKEAGFEVLEQVYEEFVHQVDRSIRRDIIVAQKQ